MKKLTIKKAPKSRHKPRANSWHQQEGEHVQVNKTIPKFGAPKARSLVSKLERGKVIYDN